MKSLSVLLVLFHGALSYWGFPNFIPTAEYLGYCSPYTIKDGDNTFNDFFEINQLNNNKGEGNVKLNTIFCFQGAGAPSILVASVVKQPEQSDKLVLFELDYQNKKSNIYYDITESCVTKYTPQLFFDNSVNCVSLELEDYVSDGKGRASFSILGGPPQVGHCFDVPGGVITSLKYIAFTTSSANTNIDEYFYMNCPSPYYSPPSSGAPRNVVVNVKQDQVAIQG